MTRQAWQLFHWQHPHSLESMEGSSKRLVSSLPFHHRHHLHLNREWSVDDDGSPSALPPLCPRSLE